MKISIYISVISILITSLLYQSCDVIDGPYMIDDNMQPNDTSTVVKKVLIEDFTGHRCQNCPDAAAELASLQEFYGDKIIGIAIHPHTTFSIPSPLNQTSYTYDFRTKWGNEIDNIFDISSVGLPRGMVNRVGFNTDHRLGKDEWATIVQSELQKDPIFGISLSSNVDNGNGMISVEVRALSSLNDEYKLVICLTENEILNWQKYSSDIENYEHNHVLRCLINTTYGESIGISFNNGDVWNKDYDINLSELEQYNIDYSTNDLIMGNGNAGGWDENNMEIVAYVYKVDNNEIVQVEEIHLTNN